MSLYERGPNPDYRKACKHMKHVYRLDRTNANAMKLARVSRVTFLSVVVSTGSLVVVVQGSGA